MLQRYTFYILIVFLGIFPKSMMAADEPTIFQSYEDYLQNTRAYCDAPEREWYDRKTLVPVPQYPDLTTDAINNQITRTRSLDTLTP